MRSLLNAVNDDDEDEEEDDDDDDDVGDNDSGGIAAGVNIETGFTNSLVPVTTKAEVDAAGETVEPGDDTFELLCNNFIRIGNDIVGFGSEMKALSEEGAAPGCGVGGFIFVLLEVSFWFLVFPPVPPVLPLPVSSIPPLVGFGSSTSTD